MSNKYIPILAGVSLLLSASAAQAGELIFGVKAGIVDPQISGFDPTTTASAQLGYEFADFWVFDVAAEVELTRSLSDGYALDSEGGDYSYKQNGVFASLRTIGPIYAIARAGLVDATINQDGGSSSDDGIAYGVGVGFSTGIRWELELTTYELGEDPVDRLSFHLSF